MVAIEQLTSPSAIALYLCLKELGITEGDLIEKRGNLHVIIYLMQRFAIDLGHHFNWSDHVCGPRDCFWDDGFGDLHLPHYLDEVYRWWEKLSQEKKELRPICIERLAKFRRNFKEALGCEINEHDKAGIKLHALAALDYLQHISGYSYFEAGLYLTGNKIYHGQIDVKELQKILTQFDK